MCCNPLSNTARKPSGNPLTRERMSNPPPSVEKYGTKTVEKAVDERKNEQYAGIR